MSSFFDLLRCLLCCSDEDDYYYRDRTSHYRRNPSFQVEETEAAPSHYYTPSPSPSPRLSHLATSASFLPHYYSRDFGNSPDSPPNLSYKPPPPPQSTPQYYSSNNNKPPVTSFISSSSSSKPTLSSSYNPSSSSSSPKKPPQPQPQPQPTSSSNSKPHPSSPKPPPHSSSPSSPKLPPVFKSILSPASSSSSASNQHTGDGKKTTYVCVEEDSLPVFIIPEDIKALIKNEIVPKVLNRPLSPTTYKDYFAALLYSEDFYLEVNIVMV